MKVITVIAQDAHKTPEIEDEPEIETLDQETLDIDTPQELTEVIGIKETPQTEEEQDIVQIPEAKEESLDKMQSLETEETQKEENEPTVEVENISESEPILEKENILEIEQTLEIENTPESEQAQEIDETPDKEKTPEIEKTLDAKETLNETPEIEEGTKIQETDSIYPEERFSRKCSCSALYRKYQKYIDVKKTKMDHKTRSSKKCRIRDILGEGACRAVTVANVATTGPCNCLVYYQMMTDNKTVLKVKDINIQKESSIENVTTTEIDDDESKKVKFEHDNDPEPTPTTSVEKTEDSIPTGIKSPNLFLSEAKPLLVIGPRNEKLLYEVEETWPKGVQNPSYNLLLTVSKSVSSLGHIKETKEVITSSSDEEEKNTSTYLPTTKI